MRGLRCAGVRVAEHIAVTLGGGGSEPERRLRVVHITCPRCGTQREVFFRIGTVLPS